MSRQEPYRDVARGDGPADQVRRALLAMAESFGPTKTGPVELRWGLLFARLAQWDEAYVQGLELIYEGYLLHYRESRVLPLHGERETCLLAGDVFYAHGLRKIASRGEVDAVALLTRLMASCAYLRSVPVPFAVDDALWAWATAGLAALTAGGDLGDAAQVFDQTDDGLAEGSAVDVAALASAALPRLGLPGAALVLDEFEALGRQATAPAAPGLSSPDRS